MKIGMEQLIWAVIFIVFIVITALKNRSRLEDNTADGTKRARSRMQGRKEMLGRYFEEVFGVGGPKKERPTSESGPEIDENGTDGLGHEELYDKDDSEVEQPVIIDEEREERPAETGVSEKPVLKPEDRLGGFTSSLIERYKEEPVVTEKEEPHQKGFSMELLSQKSLPNAIILAEIIGPPISKRKGRRLF